MISIKLILNLLSKSIRYMTTFNQRTLKSIAVPQTRQYKTEKNNDPRALVDKILQLVDQDSDQKEMSIIEKAKEDIEIKLDDDQVTSSEMQEIKEILKKLTKDIKEVK